MEPQQQLQRELEDRTRIELEQCYKQIDEQERRLAYLEAHFEANMPRDPPLVANPFHNGLTRAYWLRQEAPDVFRSMMVTALAKAESIRDRRLRNVVDPQRPKNPLEAVRLGGIAELPLSEDCWIAKRFADGEKINRNLYAHIPSEYAALRRKYGQNILLSTLVCLYFHWDKPYPPESWISVSHLCHFPYCTHWKHLTPESYLVNAHDRYGCQVIGECTCRRSPPCFPWADPGFKERTASQKVLEDELLALIAAEEPPKRKGRPSKGDTTPSPFLCSHQGCNRAYKSRKTLTEHVKLKHPT